MNQRGIVLVIAIAVILGLPLFAKIEFQSKLTPQNVAIQLSKMLGAPVTVEKAAVNWAGKIDLTGLTLREGSKPMLSAPKTRVQVRLLYLLFGEISAESVVLKSPQLNLDNENAKKLLDILLRQQGFSIACSGGGLKYTTLNGKTMSFHDIGGIVRLHSQKIPFYLTLLDPQNGSYEISGTAAANHMDVFGKIKNVTLDAIPNFQGKIDAEVNASGPLNRRIKADAKFNLTKVFYRGRAFPDVAGKAAWDAPKLNFSSLTLSVSPPFNLTGAYSSQNEMIHLAGDLTGQSLLDLLALVGCSNRQGNGRLSGRLAVSGTPQSPQIAFHGRINAMTYQGVQLGGGKLYAVAELNTLTGKLILDRPSSLRFNDGKPGSPRAIMTSIGNFFGNLFGVKMKGVDIKGTPQQPKLSPIL